MPLKKGRSQEVISENTRTEYKSLRRKGVPKAKAVKQAAAISYAEAGETKRRPMPRKKG